MVSGQTVHPKITSRGGFPKLNLGSDALSLFAHFCKRFVAVEARIRPRWMAAGLPQAKANFWTTLSTVKEENPCPAAYSDKSV